MSDYKRAKVAVSIPYGDGRHVAEAAGTVFAIEAVDDLMRDRFAEDDPWLANLFEDASAEDYNVFRGFVEQLQAEKADEGTVEAEATASATEVEPETPLKQQRRRTKKALKEDATP